MESFELTIRLGNDAMQSPDDVARALREIADQLESRYAGGDWTVPESKRVIDDNGNRVGEWDVNA